MKKFFRSGGKKSVKHTWCSWRRQNMFISRFLVRRGDVHQIVCAWVLLNDLQIHPKNNEKQNNKTIVATHVARPRPLQQRRVERRPCHLARCRHGNGWHVTFRHGRRSATTVRHAAVQLLVHFPLSRLFVSFFRSRVRETMSVVERALYRNVSATRSRRKKKSRRVRQPTKNRRRC